MTEDELLRWRAIQEQAEADELFFSSMCGVMVADRSFRGSEITSR